MSTMSSSRAERRLRRLAGGLLGAVVLACGSVAQVAPEAPRSALPVAERPSAEKAVAPQRREPVELRSVAARRVSREIVAEAMGEQFAAEASAPIVLEVRTRRPLGDLGRTSSPVIVLNGEALSETIPLAPDRLLAYLPDVEDLRRVNEIAVAWLGDEERTQSREPLTLRAEAVEGLQP